VSVVPEATELEPLTKEQVAAIRACRWSTTNLLHTYAWLNTDSEEIRDTLAPVVNRTETYTRDTKTGKQEWEMLAARDDVVALVLEEMRKR
jgi:hypothetical protein